MMKNCVVVVVAVLVCYGMVSPGYATPLDDYVNKPDPSYEWSDTGARIHGKGWTGYVLNMTSQTWLTPEDFDFSQSPYGHVWFHDFVVVVPDNLNKSCTHGLLWITGGGNHFNPASYSDTDEDIILPSQIAMKTGCIAASLFQIPNQHIVFTADPLKKHRSEDAAIAFTWRHFVDHPDQPEWLLRLPMTKAAVRAMDTMTAFGKTLNIQVDEFLVAGASKRGWTTWTVGAVDPRVKAIIPIVLDALRFQEFMHFHYRAYGGWSFALKDYWDENITNVIDDPRLTQMAAIVDPYNYRHRLTMPKLAIMSVGDEFQLPDDSRRWIGDMPGEMHMLMIQNAEHSLITGILEALEGVTSFAQAVIQNVPRPTYSFQVDPQDGRITVKTNERPKSVTMRFGSTVDGKRRDFRWAILKEPCHTISVFGGCVRPILWFGQGLAEVEPNTYVAAMAPPGEGWRAFFAEMKFHNPAGEDFLFTTVVSIVPDTLPFPDCGTDCKGELV